MRAAKKAKIPLVEFLLIHIHMSVLDVKEGLSMGNNPDWEKQMKEFGEFLHKS